MDGDYPGGGSRGLLGVLDKAGGAVYSDLLLYYGVDMQGLFEDPPTLSPRRAMVLINGLPVSSQTSALARDTKEAIGWDINTYLLAALIDSVKENTFANVQVRTKKKLTPPQRVPVPGVEEDKKKSPNNFIKMAQRFFNSQQGG